MKNSSNILTRKFTLDEDVSKRKIVKIEKSGGSCSADCPKCGKINILGGMEMRTMYVICSGCYSVFNLVK